MRFELRKNKRFEDTVSDYLYAYKRNSDVPVAIYDLRKMLGKEQSAAIKTADEAIKAVGDKFGINLNEGAGQMDYMEYNEKILEEIDNNILAFMKQVHDSGKPFAEAFRLPERFQIEHIIGGQQAIRKRLLSHHADQFPHWADEIEEMRKEAEKFLEEVRQGKHGYSSELMKAIQNSNL